MYQVYYNTYLVGEYHTLALAVFDANVMLDDGEDFLLTIKHDDEILFKDWASNTWHLSLVQGKEIHHE